MSLAIVSSPHPHRGIETVTYMMRGEVEHGDSMGNKGVINSGEVQWMTAGSGIIHQEMPRPFKGNMMGFQLWVNLPSKEKMAEPRYMGITELPTVVRPGAEIKVISGVLDGVSGPVKELYVDVEYFDVTQSGEFSHRTEKRTAFIHVYEGTAVIQGK